MRAAEAAARRAARRVRQVWRESRRPPIVECVRDALAGVDGAECITLRAPSVVHRTPPRTLEPALHPKFVRAPSYDVPEKYLARIPGGRLVAAGGLLVLPDGSFAAESTFGSEAMLRSYGEYTAPLPKHPVRQRGRYYSLVSHLAEGGNYYHWTHDVLMRLYLVVDHLPDDVTFLVPPNLRGYQYEGLAAVGVDTNRLSVFDGHECVEFEELYFSPLTPASGADLPEADEWFRARCWSHFGVEQPTKSRRLYLSRQHAAHRRLVNHDEVEAFLHARGFETVVLDGMTLAEQVRLLASAAAVVAPHGAGLTNVVFSAPGIPVIDLFEPDEPNHCFWNLCHVVGHRYWYAMGETVPNGAAYADIRMPLDTLSLTLEHALAE